MRVNLGLVTAFAAAFLCQTALADEPPAASQAAPGSAPAEQSAAPTGEQKSAAAPTAHQNAADAGSTSIKPGLTVTTGKPELTPADKEMLSRGYKLEMRHGEKYFCRSETPIGSRFPIKNCDTADSIEAHRQESQDAVRAIEANRSQVNH
jgi:hypothetical protein